MSKDEAIGAITRKVKEMSTEAILFHQAVADMLGLHITDHKSLELIHHLGAMPAGKLSELTGMTTGAVTGIIDRLENAGYVRRASDPNDRRRTIIEPTGNRKLERRIQVIFIPLHERMHKLLSSYSDDELALLLNFNKELIEQLRQESKRLRSL